MPNPPLAAVVTLGCKLNLADSQHLSEMLAGAGFDVVPFLCEADAIVVNTCSVTAMADQKSRKLIRAARRLSPNGSLAVAGCYPATSGEEAIRALGVDIIAGTSAEDRRDLVAALRRRAAGDGDTCPPSANRARPRGRNRAFISAQTGCNDACAFCVIPRTRGRERSRSPEAVCHDILSAISGGAREVVITGTQLGAWGSDLPSPGRGPEPLLTAILAATDIPRIRLSSLQPEDLTPRLLALWADPRLMPHFHLAVQSGSDRVLRSMRRRYTASEFLRAVERIRAAVPDAAITTDVIVGFPGETAADFEATLVVCREAGFARIHGFPYSPRPRTLAATLPDQVPAGEKRRRMRELLAAAEDLARRFEATQLGRVRPVLWEEAESAGGESFCFGYTDNYIRVRAAGEGLSNRITPARLLERSDACLIAEPAALTPPARR